jgi:hypothetical protein
MFARPNAPTRTQSLEAMAGVCALFGSYSKNHLSVILAAGPEGRRLAGPEDSL